MTTGKALDGKPYAGNPHVRFDEGEVAPAAKPRRGSLLYKAFLALLATSAALSVCAATVNVPTGSTVRLSDNSPADDFVLAGGVLDLDVSVNVTKELTGTITGSGEISKTGAGTLVFNGGGALTSSTTITVEAGYLRFKDFAEAGGAKVSCASGGYIGNVSGYSITIPETTEFVENGVVGLSFLGSQTNNVAAALTPTLTGSSRGKINVFGEGTAGAAVRFCGTLPCRCKANTGVEHYFIINNGMTVIFAKEADVPVVDYFECSDGKVVFETAYPAQLPGNVAVNKGTVDLDGNDRHVLQVMSRGATDTPVNRTFTNSSAADTTLTIGTPTVNRTLNFTFDDGAGTLNLNLNSNTSDSKTYDLNNAIFRNSSLTVASGTLELDESQRTIATGRTWQEAPFVKGRYLRLTVTNSVYGNTVRISDIRLTRSGYEIAWPAGTTVASDNPSREDTCPGNLVDDDLQTFWNPDGYNPGSSEYATAVISMGRDVCFNGYKMAAGTSASSAPCGWTLDVGNLVDGSIVWERIDDVWANRETEWHRTTGETWKFLTYYDVLYYRLQSYDAGYPYIVFPVTPAQGVATCKRPIFENPGFALSVAADASMSLNGYVEEIGSLTVDGDIEMSGTSMRVGKLSGGAAGFIDLDGTGVLELDGAAGTTWPHEIKGGGKISLRDGSVAGAGTLTGDYELSFDGGALAGSAAVSGTLTLSGTPTFEWDGVRECGRKTYLAAGNFAAGSADLLAGARVVNIPSPRCRVSVDLVGNKVEVHVGIPGMTLIVR